MMAHLHAALQAPVANATRKLLLVALAKYADDAGVCWPSVMTLQRLVGLTHKRHIYEHLGALRDAGLLTWDERRGRGNVYRLSLEPVTVGAPVTAGALVTPASAQKGKEKRLVEGLTPARCASG